MQLMQGQRWFDRLLERSPDYVSVGLVVVFGFLLARLTWMSFPANPQGAALVDASPAETNPAAGQDLGAQIAGYHLFGTYNPAQPAAVPKTIPDSTLSLQLRGVYALPGERGFAVIEDNAEQRLVSVGHDVGESGKSHAKSGVVLEQVFNDHVLLRVNGQIQKKSFPKLGAGGGGVAGNPGAVDGQPTEDNGLLPTQVEPPMVNAPDMPPAGGMMPSAPPTDLPPPGNGAEPPSPPPAESSLGEFRQSVAQNPMRLMEAISPSPYEVGGKFMGFRVMPGSNETLFNKSGLQRGDIVTAINGTALDSPAKGVQALQGAASGSSLSLQINRNGQQRTLPITF